MSRDHTITTAFDDDELAALLKRARKGESRAATLRRIVLEAMGRKPGPRLPGWLTPEVRKRLGADSYVAIAEDVGVRRETVARWHRKLEGL